MAGKKRLQGGIAPFLIDPAKTDKNRFESVGAKMTFRELLDVSLHNDMLVFNEDDELIGSYSDSGINDDCEIEMLELMEVISFEAVDANKLCVIVEE